VLKVQVPPSVKLDAGWMSDLKEWIPKSTIDPKFISVVSKGHAPKEIPTSAAQRLTPRQMRILGATKKRGLSGEAVKLVDSHPGILMGAVTPKQQLAYARQQRRELTKKLRGLLGSGELHKTSATLDSPTARVISQLLQKSDAKERKARQLLADEKLKRVGTERTGTGTEEKPPITVDTTVQDKLSQAKMAGLKKNPFAPQIKRQLLERKGDIMKKIQRKLQSKQKVGRFSRMFNPRSIYGPDPKSGTIRV